MVWNMVAFQESSELFFPLPSLKSGTSQIPSPEERSNSQHMHWIEQGPPKKQLLSPGSGDLPASQGTIIFFSALCLNSRKEIRGGKNASRTFSLISIYWIPQCNNGEHITALSCCSFCLQIWDPVDPIPELGGHCWDSEDGDWSIYGLNSPRAPCSAPSSPLH